MAVPTSALPPITTVLLAGGQGSRMGGDKGLQLLHGKALLAWVLERVRPHSDEVLLSANDKHEVYGQFGCPLLSDHLPGYAGPLAGLQAALHRARNDWVLSVPCDTPWLPADLLPRLYAALHASTAEAAVASAGGRRHPAIALYRKSVQPQLDAYLAGGGRKVNDWLNSLQLREVEFEDEAAFANINSREDLARANQSKNNC
ncbi:MAG TPA: molybdenum cofactor guanylyltransferase MobA [Gallionellaceae bacterium]